MILFISLEMKKYIYISILQLRFYILDLTVYILLRHYKILNDIVISTLLNLQPLI